MMITREIEKKRLDRDYIEERDGQINAFEFKWNPAKKASVPLSFRNAYPEAVFCVINRDNIEDFLL